MHCWAGGIWVLNFRYSDLGVWKALDQSHRSHRPVSCSGGCPVSGPTGEGLGQSCLGCCVLLATRWRWCNSKPEPEPVLWGGWVLTMGSGPGSPCARAWHHGLRVIPGWPALSAAGRLRVTKGPREGVHWEAVCSTCAPLPLLLTTNTSCFSSPPHPTAPLFSGEWRCT